MHFVFVLRASRIPLSGQLELSVVFYRVSEPLAPKPCKTQHFCDIWSFPLCFTMFLGLGRPCPVNSMFLCDLKLPVLFYICFWVLGADAP